MKLFMASFLLLLSLTLTAQSFSDAIIGKWISEDKKTTVEIYKTGNIFYGKIVGMSQPNDASGKPRTDLENPDESKRTRPLMGLMVMKNLQFDDGYWKDGEIYNYQNGDSYDCEVWLDGNNILKLKVQWYFVRQTETWTRVK